MESHNDDTSNPASMLKTLDIWLPVKSPEITGGTRMGDAAVPEAEGVTTYDVKVLSLVRMEKSPSGWLFDWAYKGGQFD